MGVHQSLMTAAQLEELDNVQLPIKLASTPLFHIPTGAKLRMAEPADAYHTSLVIGGTEFSFGGEGIRTSVPLQSHASMKNRTEVEDLGYTSAGRSPHAMMDVLAPWFQPGTYDLVCKNCNSFSDSAVFFMLGTRLASKYNRIEKLGRAGEKRVGLMSALQVIGLNYKANPHSQGFAVEDVLHRIVAYNPNSGYDPDQIAHKRKKGLSSLAVCC
ncbi:unnamed protein product [Polarella glacialis]|uniref:PPPDE domain-containing protein n=1 Tax=Polarella glacialis TaxID=89957 RepID=A0A813LH55_POLGL|nr:unnamed protein product [Polarella glacialis]